MGGSGERQSSKSAILLLALVLVAVPTNALNIGVQSANSSIYASKQQCSRKCESEHCTVPPFLRYGKYCGILYTGCPGEKPCDGLDACCQVHDNCVQTHNNDYLSLECNGNFLNCIAGVKESQGFTFRGNTCIVDEVVDVLSLVMEAALLAGRALHKP